MFLTRTLDRLSRHYLKSRGFYVSKFFQKDRDEDYALNLSGYSDGAKKFSYSAYAEKQIEGNKRKFDLVWADQETVRCISEHLRRHIPNVRQGLCHGSRNGSEIRWFATELDCKVIGTDISPTATAVPDMVQWDFHEENPDWVGQFDFVYTNSHDHAYDPKKAVDAWVGQLSDRGVLYLEHTTAHSESGVTELDPFGVNPKILPFVVLGWGQGRYCVQEILKPPHRKAKGDEIWIFCIRKVATAA
ncbi:hypothetical protein [Chthonobacter albigriseus]|uniref:hypothetical protein n=1 Tax=Chthonobacter albigriseus TaxID=1683161 RepID=UPI0015EF2054|nr:hypothetical protein [Chthonobacter albigriseus]